MNGFQPQHDIWLVLTLLSIMSWVILLISLRSLFIPIKKIWPELYLLFIFVGVGMIGVILEIICAEIAAAFYPNPVIYYQNPILRIAGRSLELISVLTAIIARYKIKLKGKT